MSYVVAFATVEHVPLDVVADREEVAARSVDRGVPAVGTGDAFDDRALDSLKREGDREHSGEVLEGHC